MMNNALQVAGVIGPQELIVIGLLVLVIFGAKKLPEFGKGLGSMMREFKKATDGLADDAEGVKAKISTEDLESPTPVKGEETPPDSKT